MEKKKEKEERETERKINLLKKTFYLNGVEKFCLIFRRVLLFYLPHHFSQKFYSDAQLHLSEFHSYRYFFHLCKENANVYTNVYTEIGSSTRKLLYDPYDLIKLVVRGIKNTILNNYLYIYIHYNTYNTLQYSRKITRNYTFGNLTNFQKKKKIPFFPSLPIDRIERLNTKYNWTKRRIHRLTY